MTNDRIAPTTEGQELAKDLAVAYHGFLRGMDTDSNFDRWYYGEKLVATQKALGFEMLDCTTVSAIARRAWQEVEEARKATPPNDIELI